MTTNNTKWVVFIDALHEDDLSRTELLDDFQQGRMDAPAPRVTPRILSEVYTGLSPAENGMLRSQMAGAPDQTRPQQTTVFERAQANGLDILNLHMPYSIPMNVFQGSAGLGVAAAGEQSGGPQELIPQMTVPGPAGDLIGDRRHDIVFDHMVDYVRQLFSTARTLAPNFDVVFIGFRGIDSYCHFQYDTGPDGRGVGVGNRYRDMLTEAIDIQIEELLPRGDVLVFSDHGATELTETFYVNKWLKENGYLSYKIDEDFIEQAREYGVIGGEQHPVNVRVENQTVIGQPGVVLDDEESQAICQDPYDGCITLLDESVSAELVDDLSGHELIRDVHTRGELFDRGARFFNATPHIIPDRDRGVFATGNVHPDPIGMGYYRTGVHDKYGYLGSNVELSHQGDVTPAEMNTVIEEFLELDRAVNPIPQASSRLIDEEREAIVRDT